MTLFSVSLSYLKARKAQTLLHVILMALGLSVMMVFWAINQQIVHRLAHDGGGFDAVIGAKGSPIQLILSSLYHADIPTGNIRYKSYEALLKNRQIKTAIPLALGDAYHGFRIVGTTPDYVKHYHANLDQGRMMKQPFDAVIGSQVAHATGLALGDRFESHHGVMGEGHAHDEQSYVVRGVLGESGTVLDRLIVTPLASVWKLHDEDHAHEQHHDDTHHDHHREDRVPEQADVTAILVKFSSAGARVNMPRMLERQMEVQVAVPAFEMTRLLNTIGIGKQLLQALALLMVSAAFLAVLIALMQALRERRNDLAVMRLLGARPSRLGLLMVMESSLICAAGAALATGLAVSMMIVLEYLAPHAGLFKPAYVMEPAVIITVITIGLGAVMALLPAWRVRRLLVASVLSGD